MPLMQKFMKMLSTSSEEINEYSLIGNCFGFFNLQGGLGTSTVCTELGNALANKGLHTCIVDCNPLSTFYLVKTAQALGDETPKDIPSIDVRLQKRTSDLKDSLIQINPNLHIICFGNTQYSATFTIDKNIIDELFTELKSTFDIVLMDIPNLPWMETVISAIKACSTVYCMAGYTYDSIYRQVKCANLFDLCGSPGVLRNIVICKSTYGQSIRKALSQEMDGDILNEIPFVPDIPKVSLGRFSVLDSISGKEARAYATSLNFFLSEILYGISNKKKDKDTEAKEA